jgi:Fic family protein
VVADGRVKHPGTRVAVFCPREDRMSSLGQRFADIDDRTEELRGLSDQHPDLWRDFLTKYELSLIYHENALEGIVVTHAELTSALKGRPIAPDTYGPIRNLKVALGLVRKEAGGPGGPITHELAVRLHDCLGQGENGFVAGRYRKIIPLHRTYFHDIAQPHLIQPRFQKLTEWAIANNPDDDEAVRFAAHFHHEFMSIFPFSEHTGKIGRLLVNYILMRHGYMPVVFHGSERQRYYDVLRHGAKDMESFLTEMMINCIENGRTYIRKELDEREKQKSRKLRAAS